MSIEGFKVKSVEKELIEVKTAAVAYIEVEMILPVFDFEIRCEAWYVILQSDVQESRFEGSSHSSNPVVMPSPQTVIHFDGIWSLHWYPNSTLHDDEHPSFESKFKSSHSSFTINPSPHTGEQC